MLPLQALFFASGFNISMSTLFIPLMSQHMINMPNTEAKKSQLAMLAMISVGVGEILGSFVFGRIQDKCSIPVVVSANCAMVLLSFSGLFWFHNAGDFNFFLASLMTFLWGF
jgi:predicted MFS family arabinose efflux permease